MKPTREGALVDLLDRILSKGAVLHADIIITVAGIPMVGVSLRAVIAGMTTMLEYGMMEAWDEEIRGRPVEDGRQGRKRAFPPIRSSAEQGSMARPEP